MPEEIRETTTEESALNAATNFFAQDDGAPPPAKPNAVPEGDEPAAPEVEPPPTTPPTSEPEPEAEPAEVKAEAKIKKPSEFVDFDTPEQKKRFNDVFGYAKRLERELETYRRQTQAPPPQPVVQQPAPTFQPPAFTETKPKLADFETADQWGEAVADWSARRAEHAVTSFRHESAQHEQDRKLREQFEQRDRYEKGRMYEGRTKFGLEFDNLAAEVANFAPPESVFYTTLFGLERFPEVIMELGKNLQEADRISRLSTHDQIYELKALEKKLIAKAALATKTQPKLPTKVEAPGQGEDPKPRVSVGKLRQAAKASGNMHDWAKVFGSDTTL